MDCRTNYWDVGLGKSVIHFPLMRVTVDKGESDLGRWSVSLLPSEDNIYHPPSLGFFGNNK